MRWIAAAAIGFGMFASVPAGAQDNASDQRDARCALALVVAAGRVQGDDNLKNLGMMSYYVGKMRGRHTPQETKTLVNAVENALKPGELDSLLPGCKQEISEIAALFSG